MKRTSQFECLTSAELSFQFHKTRDGETLDLLVTSDPTEENQFLFRAQIPGYYAAQVAECGYIGTDELKFIARLFAEAVKYREEVESAKKFQKDLEDSDR